MKSPRLRNADEDLSPDHDEALAYTEVEAWVKFAAAAIASPARHSVTEAAALADKMLHEFRQRFHTDEESARAAANLPPRPESPSPKAEDARPFDPVRDAYPPRYSSREAVLRTLAGPPRPGDDSSERPPG